MKAKIAWYFVCKRCF